jgi:hypothetical protein
MHARVTLVEIDTMRISLDAALERYRADVQARLAEQDAYEGVLVMANPDGRGMVITLWSSEEAAKETGGLYAEAIERFVTFFRQPSGRDHYEVLVADVPARVPTPEA